MNYIVEDSSGFPHSGETLLSSSLRCNHHQPTFFPSLNLATLLTAAIRVGLLFPHYHTSAHKVSLRQESHRVKLPQPILITSPENPIASHGAVRSTVRTSIFPNLDTLGPRPLPRSLIPHSPTELRAGRAFEGPRYGH